MGTQMWAHLSVQAMILFGSWTVFFVVWMAMAFTNKRKVFIQPDNERRAYTLPLLGGILIMSGLTRYLGPLGILARPLMMRTPGLMWSAAGAALLGVLIALWARFTLGRNWSGEVTLKQDHALVTSGPYAWIRHPIYTALILLFLGLALSFVTLGGIIGMALIIWSCWVKLRQEEVLMLGQFPAAYPAYMARTKRLVPWLV